MKNLFKRIIIILAIIIASLTTTSLTYAEKASQETTDGGSSSSSTTGENTIGPCDSSFLGLTPWYCNVLSDPQSEEQLTSNIVQIASNVLTDIVMLSAYLILGFVIYGGYLYMTSSGDPGKAATSRKVLTRAFIGLAIVLLANVILNGIRIALIGDEVLKPLQDSGAANTMFVNAINFAIGIAGVVCIIFIVIGGINYTTSAGDPGKLQKAKNTLLYALIGLIIVGIAATITAFVSNLIREAGNPNGYIKQTTIAKELHEKHTY